MGILEQAREKLIETCDRVGVDRTRAIAVHPLSPDEAIGKEASIEFAIKRGKERVIEAAFGDAKGQAFTDQPSPWTGTLDELLTLDLADVRARAVFVAGLNAVLRSIGAAQGTVHCQDEEPARCGREVAGQLESRFGPRRFGLIGLQPAILEALVAQFGSGNVRVLDLNPDNVGTVKHGVQVWDGNTDLPKLIDWCEVGLATGSSLANGTIDEIVRGFEQADKPLLLFGTTVSGAAAVLGIDRICPFGR